MQVLREKGFHYSVCEALPEGRAAGGEAEHAEHGAHACTHARMRRGQALRLQSEVCVHDGALPHAAPASAAACETCACQAGACSHPMLVVTC